MSNQDKIHIPSLFNDYRKQRTTINPLLQKFVAQITTLRFQISLILMMAIVDYIYTWLNGVSGKLPEYIVLYSIEACFYFAYIHLIFPRLAAGSYSLIVILSVIAACLLLFIMLHFVAYALFTKEPLQFLSNISPLYVAGALYRGWHRMILSFFLWSAYLIKRTAKREQVLENNNLFSRISPHLLFNALNMLPSTNTAPLKNEKIIELLSRYARNAMMELADDGKGQLVHELDQLNTLLQLNELRFGKIYVELHIELPADLTDYRLPPQIILTLAENIFKHGIVNDPNKPARITINAHSRYLTVRTTNYKYPIKKPQSTQIGISSIQKRLINIYDKNYSFAINEDQEIFTVSMTFPV